MNAEACVCICVLYTETHRELLLLSSARRGFGRVDEKAGVKKMKRQVISGRL